MKENIYSVLFISTSNSFSDTIIHVLDNHYEPVKLVESISEARRELLERDYDIIIINSPLKDDFGLNAAIDFSYKYGIAVLFFARQEIYDEVYDKAYDYGIMTLSKPTSKQVVLQSLKLIESTIQRKLLYKEKSVSIKDKLEEIKLINNAKLLLIKNEKLSEDEAHKYIEKRAMFIRETKLYVAKEIIKKYHRKEKRV